MKEATILIKSLKQNDCFLGKGGLSKIRLLKSYDGFVVCVIE